jgi:4-hydroxybenzoate polyprenyltransferase
MSQVKNWIEAFRLRTLPLALSSIGLGSFLAAFEGKFKWEVLLLSGLTTIFLQVLSNLANDYGDTKHGADHSEREGPLRAVQSGAISAKSMKTGIYLFVALSLLSGFLLLTISLPGIGANLSYFSYWDYWPLGRHLIIPWERIRMATLVLVICLSSFFLVLWGDRNLLLPYRDV